MSILWDIPDDDGERRLWLERQLVGCNLGALASEIGVLGENVSGSSDDDAEYERMAARVLREGLAQLSEGEFVSLMSRPKRLLDLQERIFSAGGDYWKAIPRDGDALAGAIANGRRRLGLMFVDSPATQPARSDRSSQAWRAAPWLLSAGLAAALLLVIFSGLFDHPWRAGSAAGIAWGWGRPGAIPEAPSAAAYLNALADRAQEWFAERPTDPRTASRRLAEMRQGCTALILAEHAPLAAVDKTWLLDRCHAWAAKFDKQLAMAESGEVGQAIAEADVTIEQLTRALRKKAESLQVPT